MFYNSVICSPLLFCLTIATEEIPDVLQFEHLLEPAFLLALLGSVVFAFVLNFAIFWNTSVNSALTQSVSGQMKDVFTVLIGMVFCITLSPHNNCLRFLIKCVLCFASFYLPQ